MNYEIIDPATESGLRIEPIKYVRRAVRQGETHIIYRFVDGRVLTLCHMYFPLSICPVISDTIHLKSKLCKKCEKNSLK